MKQKPWFLVSMNSLWKQNICWNFDKWTNLCNKTSEIIVYEINFKTCLLNCTQINISHLQSDYKWIFSFYKRGTERPMLRPHFEIPVLVVCRPMMTLSAQMQESLPITIRDPRTQEATLAITLRSPSQSLNSKVGADKSKRSVPIAKGSNHIEARSKRWHQPLT